jgi:hypothetical protein
MLREHASCRDYRIWKNVNNLGKIGAMEKTINSTTHWIPSGKNIQNIDNKLKFLENKKIEKCVSKDKIMIDAD